MTTAARNLPIPLDRALLDTLSREEAELALRRVVCSVKFELLRDAGAMRLLGPEMSYHCVDPHLATGLRRIQLDLTRADVLDYRSSQRHFDLCFEDSWTSYFIAKRFGLQRERPELVLIHLDDHTDMMATLLCRVGETLVDPTTGEVFDPHSSSHWEAAIHSGAINIGNYITPWYYTGTRVHVRHLNNNSEGAELCFISRESRHYDLMPGKAFADLHSSSESAGSCGTYVVATSPHALLRNVPSAWTLVHVDLDYFINDFNGAPRGEDYVPDDALRTQALAKLDRFFDALQGVEVRIDRWLIGTSPGFCSAFHWQWLLAELGRRIEALQENCGSETA